jgi:predicted ABC-type ATPase
MWIWLKNELKIRVSEGGHNIDTKVIERRYINGLKNLFNIYLPIIDGALIFDNSLGKHELLAEKTIDGKFTIVDKVKFKELQNYYDNC